ncbi:MAG TPA: hypothetical protein VFU04_02865 [Solirubrobacterales bacterium]|nr:hypothetical protein [Solirubrobacterales bacterium]
MAERAGDKGTLLIAVAAIVSLALVGAYLAAGGASYTPAQVQDPCQPREWRDPGSIEEIAEQFSLSALDGAACELGVTRETLARALATPRSRERFTQRFGISDAELARAIRAGLVRAVDDAERAGAIPPLIAGPLRETVRQIPLDQAIELIQDARQLLDQAQTFLGPAQGLLEQFLP